MVDELVERARHGDRDAFAALVQMTSDRMYAIATRILRDRDLAEDALQGALLAARKNLPTLRDPARFEAWLRNMHATPHASNLYLIQPDGTGLRQLTRSSVDGNMRIVQPRWSPDGKRIVCAVGTSSASNFTTDDLRLAFVDPAGGEPVLISPVVHGSQPDLRPTPPGS